MSRYFSKKFAHLTPYVPGEQPKDMKYLKLNTNESPFEPVPEAASAVADAAERLMLYSDPESTVLVKRLAEIYGSDKNEIIVSNGSDEVLNFAFSAFCDDEHPAVFADITYGFYKVFAQYNRVPYREIPLRDDFSMDVDALAEANGTLFIANPNAPTGIVLSLDDIEKLVRSDPSRVVVVDEAYIDFGGESAVSLTRKYNNLLVTQTFSKSRSLAGARLGYGMGCADLIADLKTIQYSTNPYNVNSLTAAAALAVLNNEERTKASCRMIADTRERASERLREMGFSLTPSAANFIFAAHSKITGKALYEKLKARGVLVRHFDIDRIAVYNRITVGTVEQMEILCEKIKEILEEENANV